MSHDVITRYLQMAGRSLKLSSAVPLLVFSGFIRTNGTMQYRESGKSVASEPSEGNGNYRRDHVAIESI
jgi:hypothetical protein